MRKRYDNWAICSEQKNKHVELVAAGGVISVLQFGSREVTRDVDVIFPSREKSLLKELIAQVGRNLSLPIGDHAWLNDGVSFFGLKTRTDNLIFNHTHLKVYTASWYELLGMKLSGAWRRDADFNDAIHILKEIGRDNKEETLQKSLEHKNFSPYIEDEVFEKRFNRVWKEAFGS